MRAGRTHFTLLVAAIGALQPAYIRAEDKSLQASEIEAASAMDLAATILPPQMRDEIIAGEKHKEFVAGPRYWIGYHTAPFASYVIPAGFCARYRIAVRLEPVPKRTLEEFKSEQDRERMLLVKSIQRDVMVAMPVEGEPTPQVCAKIPGYIEFNGAGDAKAIEGYRQLVAAMREARAGRNLPFKLTCQIEGWSDEDAENCDDGVAALAELPMTELYAISANDDPDEDTDELKGFGAAFGSSPDDGLSWRVYWSVADDGRISELRLRKIGVVYH